jgi:hypothetical protein
MPAPKEHMYHAEATVLEGRLHLPISQVIERQAHAKLPIKGGYLSQHTESFRIEGIVSYRAAHTQVSGHLEIKRDRGFKTLATSVVEDLNILEVVTADRVVAQISTEHPLNGDVPSVTFLGTRFENLRIAGHPVKFHLDPDVLGPKPKNDAAYTSDPDLMERIAKRNEPSRAIEGLSDELPESYNQDPSSADIEAAGAESSDNQASDDRESIECSLVSQVEGSYPGRSFGHVIDVPHFGKIYLAVLRLEHSKFPTKPGSPKLTLFDLTMIRVKMGCIATGDTTVVTCKTNGIGT